MDWADSAQSLVYTVSSRPSTQTNSFIPLTMVNSTDPLAQAESTRLSTPKFELSQFELNGREEGQVNSGIISS